ncbi:MAG: polysaccharide biosynthesis C-terminal domain-containing protein [Candidatus Wallbacteria bacterium]|nr:polysaccharide biosynthesis C-terminal domain-containing protein [Candidatus Wallbacteria bacterium]
MTAERRILTAGITVAVGMSCVKLVSVAKDTFVAAVFGRSGPLDAYLFALGIVSFAINVIAGAFQVALVPALIQARHEDGDEAAQRLLASALVPALALLVAVAVALGCLAAPLIASLGGDYLRAKTPLVRHLMLLMLPTIPLGGLSLLAGSVLNASGRFAFPAMTPLATPLLTIVLLLGARGLGVEALALGFLAGSVFELALLAAALRAEGFALVPKWYGQDKRLQGVARQCAPVIAGAFLMGNSPLIDQVMASWLGAGNISALNYGNKVVSLVLSISSGALGSVTLPHFSLLVATGDWRALGETFHRCRRWILVASVVGVLALFPLSNLLVGLLFERGAFQHADTLLVSRIQMFYALQVPFYLAGLLSVRVISSMARNEVLLYFGTINLAVNIAGNLLFSKFMGVAGIALSTAVVYALSDFMLATYVRRVGLRSVAARAIGGSGPSAST